MTFEQLFITVTSIYLPNTFVTVFKSTNAESEHFYFVILLSIFSFKKSGTLSVIIKLNLICKDELLFLRQKKKHKQQR